MPKIKAVVFDMDGVLIDAREWHYEALNKALSIFGYSINRYEHLVSYDGLPTRKKLEILSRDQGLPRSLHQFINTLKQDFTIEKVHQECRPIFQHELALSRLKAAGYKLAVASNSVRASVELMMQKSNLIDYLELLLSNEEVANPKPSPDIYLMAAEQLGVSPENCLVLEDNEKGIQAAVAAGTQLMTIGHVLEVTLPNILKRIGEVENGS